MTTLNTTLSKPWLFMALVVTLLALSPIAQAGAIKAENLRGCCPGPCCGSNATCC
jgi:hypothetical protein